jgi:hypothetical protein
VTLTGAVKLQLKLLGRYYTLCDDVTVAMIVRTMNQSSNTHLMKIFCRVKTFENGAGMI